MADRASGAPFWEDTSIVERFAARAPDHRLVDLAGSFATPARTRILDLGCAGGRNTVFLVQRGFDVLAVDGSAAMVSRTRERLAEIVDSRAAASRVLQGRMDDLSPIPDGSIDLVIALGIYHAARSEREWALTLEESARVLARGGEVLVANHTDAFDPEGKGLRPVPGERHLYDGLPSGRSYLVDADGLDRAMAGCGFDPVVPTQTVIRPTEEGGRRATANGRYTRS